MTRLFQGFSRYSNPLAARSSGLLLLALLAGCANSAFMGRDGPTLKRIKQVSPDTHGALLIDMNDAVARRIESTSLQADFRNTFGAGQAYGTIVGQGDVLQVAIYEAPPAILFGASGLLTSGLPTGGGMRDSNLPPVQVDSSGLIDVPFAGRIQAAGQTLHALQLEIAAKLHGKAHDPQVMVAISKQAASTVTVVGEVATSSRMPLTDKGERLLDALAAAGGTRQPVDKVSLQLTRGDKGVTLPLERIISDPSQNIYLKPGDIVTALYQSRSFTVLGATGKNEEVKFEAQGITLAQALGRMGGLRDDTANPSGVFIFRFERPLAIAPEAARLVPADPEGRIPVIYRVDLRDPAAFFAAQHFAMNDHDIVYVTNAPVTDLQKFVNIIGAAVYPLVTVKAAGI